MRVPKTAVDNSDFNSSFPRIPSMFLPAMENQILLAHVLNRSRTWVLAHPEYNPTPDESRVYHSLLARTMAGEPIPYLIGTREFFSLDFAVSPAALIPRPETELLVEKALAWLDDRRLTGDPLPAVASGTGVQTPTPLRCGGHGTRGLRRRPQRSVVGGRRSDTTSYLAADVGTGSGCIAVALAYFCPELEVAAIDVSPEALAVARANARRHGVADRIHFYQGDLLAPLTESVQLICANLPYIPTRTLESLPISKTEPRLALDGGLDGLDLIRRLLLLAPAKLAPGGVLYLEIEATHGPPTLALARAAFPAAEVSLHQDLAGLDRLIEFQT